MIKEKPVAAIRERLGRPDVDKALLVTGVVGGAVFIGLMIAAGGIYDAVSEADGISGLDKPVLEWAISLRNPTLDLWVTAFTNLGRTVPMVLIAGILTTSLVLRYRAEPCGC